MEINKYMVKAKHTHLFVQNQHLNGTWVYGLLVADNYIFDNELGGEMLIDTNTICRPTMLLDNNGNMIWENDLLKSGKDIWEVLCSEIGGGWYAALDGDYRATELSYFVGNREYEIIGNAFDVTQDDLKEIIEGD
jgi:YopX protein.